MNKKGYFAPIFTILFLITVVNLKAEENNDALFQTSTIGALMAGDYDGELSTAELGKHGDFGLGTFNQLDGEMIALDGIFYKVKSDGKVEVVPGSAKTPFATVTFFEQDRSAALNKSIGCKALEEYLETLLPTGNIMYAIKIEGSFVYVKTRSVPKQKKPYPPLADVVEIESIFELKKVDGTMVGFRMPDYAEGVSPTGFHFHFISDSRKTGGHVLGCTTKNVRIEIDDIRELHLSLPDTSDFYNTDLNRIGSGNVTEMEKEKKHSRDED